MQTLPHDLLHVSPQVAQPNAVLTSYNLLKLRWLDSAKNYHIRICEGLLLSSSSQRQGLVIAKKS